MARSALVISVLAVMVALVSGCSANRLTPISVRAERPSLGGLEHRDNRHELRDLLDPFYCAGANDEFAREFNAQTLYAGTWSGHAGLWAGD
jgi:hypothetical protein